MKIVAGSAPGDLAREFAKALPADFVETVYEMYHDCGGASFGIKLLERYCDCPVVH